MYVYSYVISAGTRQPYKSVANMSANTTEIPTSGIVNLHKGLHRCVHLCIQLPVSSGKLPVSIYSNSQWYIYMYLSKFTVALMCYEAHSPLSKTRKHKLTKLANQVQFSFYQDVIALNAVGTSTTQINHEIFTSCV